MAKRRLFTWGRAGGWHSAQQNRAVALREAFEKVAFVRELSFLFLFLILSFFQRKINEEKKVKGRQKYLAAYSQGASLVSLS